MGLPLPNVFYMFYAQMDLLNNCSGYGQYSITILQEYDMTWKLRMQIGYSQCLLFCCISSNTPNVNSNPDDTHTNDVLATLYQV